MPPVPPLERRIVGTSLKMYFSPSRTLSYTKNIASLAPLAAASNVDLFLIPDFLNLTSCASILSSTPDPVLLGAQDTYFEDYGAFTGEVSPQSLKDIGVSIVELGHAERRRLFGETDGNIAKKAAAVVRNGMIPLICVGEVSAPSSGPASAAVGMAVRECRTQMLSALAAIPDGSEVIFAYEPVWAIGASEPAGKDHVVAVTKELRRICGERKGRVRILYGGSAGPGTFENLKEGVDGLFLGRFAHEVGNLEKVIEEMKRT
ncbi:triosephosphate isomeras-like protein [Patellaria atrata CBS 101060]|uniref:Triosephosphate isomerase n=1 Tax=Patellaria atrata CBS 101060 TaxID=1346257 RepID=A0A9P4S4K1_9PEZI|nr:triosephosphate isomeras-like protein [Patellaria atrata CBS 101060]